MKDFLRYIVRYSTRIYEFVLILSFALICFFPSIATKEYIMYLIFCLLYTSPSPRDA